MIVLLQCEPLTLLHAPPRCRSLVGNQLDAQRFVPEELFSKLTQLQYPWWYTLGPPFEKYVPSSIPAFQDIVSRTREGKHTGTNVATRRRR